MSRINAAAAAVLMVCAGLLSGCRWIPITDLQDRAIVQGVGVDWKNDEYVLQPVCWASYFDYMIYVHFFFPFWSGDDIVGGRWSFVNIKGCKLFNCLVQYPCQCDRDGEHTE